MTRSVITPEQLLSLRPEYLPKAPLLGPMPSPTVRPIHYTPGVADEICRRLVEGSTLRELEMDPTMPVLTTILAWVSRYPDFGARYRQAREDSTHAMEADMLHIVAAAKTKDEAAAARVKVDAMKFIMGARSPRQFGPKVDMTVRQEVARLPVSFKNLEPSDIKKLREIIGRAVESDRAAKAVDVTPGIGGGLQAGFGAEDASVTDDEEGQGSE